MTEEDFMFSEEFDEFLSDCYSSLDDDLHKLFERYVLNAEDRKQVIERAGFFIITTKWEIEEVDKHLLKLVAGGYHKLAEEDH